MGAFDTETTILKALKYVAIAVVLGVGVGLFWGSYPSHKTAEPTAPVSAAVTSVPKSDPAELTSNISEPRERVPVQAIDDDVTTYKIGPGDYTCTTTEVVGGTRTTCGPRHIDPTNDDCSFQGLIRVCIRRYGIQTCDCYPEG